MLRSRKHGPNSLTSLSSLSQPSPQNSQSDSDLSQDVQNTLQQAQQVLPTSNASARAPTTATLPTETPRTILNSLRRHPNIYSDQTLLLDISPAHWGIFTGESPSFTLIREKFVRKTRHVWCKFTQKLLDDSSSENWKKVLLLPIVLFDITQSFIVTGTQEYLAQFKSQ